LQWSTNTRSFQSHAPESDDLLVINAEHKIEYLSAESAELSVGITYEGMPRINLANFVINQIDENTGVFQALLTAAKKPVVDAMEKGVDEMAEMLDDRMHGFFGQFISSDVAGSVIDPIYAELGNPAHPYDPEAVLNDYVGGELNLLIRNMSSGMGNANYLVSSISDRLTDIEIGLTAIIDGVWLDAFGNPIPRQEGVDPDFTGFLAKSGGEFQILSPFIEHLLAELAPDISDELNQLLSGAVDDLNARINALLSDAAPTIDQVVVLLTDLRDLVAQVRGALDAGGEMLTELQTILTASTGDINTLTGAIKEDLLLYFSAMETRDDFLAYSEQEIKARIRNEIEDNFFAASFVAEIQCTLKQYLYDVDSAINGAISEAFAQVNNVIRNLVSGLLAEVDDRINACLDDVNSVMGAGKVNGYAEFTGDALRRLHIDLYLQLKVPDEMEFNGYLTIEQMGSKGDGSSCSPGDPDVVATEVRMGAIDVPVEWLSPGLRISVGAKFNFQSSPDFKLLGLGGSFEMTRGVISFEAFKITDMGAALMFGKYENYLAAKLGLAFNSYEAYGGVYFGRTCSMDPLLLVDKDVAQVLGEPSPTFTGIYMYGECQIPISEVALGVPASCMFNISAGIGAGAFYFLEGNPLGGKMFASVTGEALCVVTIKGEITMIGILTGGELRFRGKGRITGKAGPCPICIKFGKTATITFQGGSWDVDI
jgi:hypothetical protein